MLDSETLNFIDLNIQQIASNQSFLSFFQYMQNEWFCKLQVSVSAINWTNLKLDF